MLNPHAANRRVRTLRVAPELWVELLRTTLQPQPWAYTVTCDTAIPDDLTICGLRIDYWQGCQVVLLVSSTTFDEVPEEAEPPEWTPRFTRHDVAGAL